MFQVLKSKGEKAMVVGRTLGRSLLVVNDVVLRLDMRKKFFTGRMVKHLAQAARRGSGGPIPGNFQGQVEQGSEQPGLVEDVPAHCRYLG